LPDDIFKGFFDYDALNAYSMKMTRDAEYDLVHEMESSLMELMSSSLKQRLTAEPVRFVYQRDMPDAMVEMLRDKLSISNYDSMLGGRYHNFKDFIGFPNVGKANLVNKPMPRLRHLWFDKFRNGFDAIRERDVLLYYPIILLSMCWSCCVRPRSTPAYWRSKSTSTAWPRIRASSTR
jgi:polyphosphate kinase